jgi:hypothetical protein
MNREAVQAELAALKSNGVIRPADVVEHARNPESAMHGWFEWDDTEAAAQYRLEQARRLLRVYVTVKAADTTPLRTFVSLSTDREQKGGGYREMQDVMSDEQLRAQLLADAFKELRAAQTKYRGLQQLSGVWEALDEAEGDVRDAA